MDFKQLFTDHGIKISNAKFQKLEQLYTLFTDFNSQINLSAIRDERGIWEKHFLDSLLVTKFFNLEGKKILDIGSGGGFPALLFPIFYENVEVVALDSVGKKMKVVQQMADSLDLNVKTVHGRIEDFGQNSEFREQFDIVTARALAPWTVLLEYALPFVKVHGKFIAYQGPSIEKDLEKHKNLEVRLGGKIKGICADRVNDMERLFVSIQKKKACPKRYPRKNGEPRLKPLK